MVGYGWGLTSVILDKKSSEDTLAVQKLVDLLQQFPDEHKENLFKGVQKAFAPGITPVLDFHLLNQLEYSWKSHGNDSN